MDMSGIEDPGIQNYVPAISSTSARSGNNTMVGFEDDLMQIKDRLTGQQSKLQIIPIVGMGGTGKTTLARNAYADPYIVYHFHVHVWVVVTQEYSVREILLGLVLGLGGLTNEKHNEGNEKLAEYVYKKLKGNRYLIVMDDMWKVETWRDMRRIFPDDNNGSRILLTTRLSNVAVYANCHGPHHQMRFLTEDESWNLLHDVVFEREHCPPNLVKIGKVIAKNCRGLPLAIVVIGGLLSKANITQEYWEYIAENVSSVVNANDEQCSKILSLSYKHLPHHLKPCFLYMGIFPEDYEISVSKIIKLWVAEGFLKPKGPISLEAVAEDYINDLIDRNLILIRQQGSNKRVKTCSIHDLLRDLCVRRAQKEKFYLFVNNWHDGNMQGGTSSRRRMSIHATTRKDEDDAIYSYGSTDSMFLVRSFLYVGPYLSELPLHLGLRLLRVLDTADIHFRPEILILVNLRYLAINHSSVLPSSISVLWNLQTLIVRQSMFITPSALPLEIWNMTQLRHLRFDMSTLPDCPADLIYSDSFILLENLETLSGIGYFRCTEDVLKRIPNLKSLKIFYNEASSIVDWSCYCLHNLGRLHNLEQLSCRFDSSPESIPPPKFTFPHSLKKLTLDGCSIPWKDMTIIGSLPNLEVLKLIYDACDGPEWETNEGEFCQLTFLMIDLENWITDSTHFPRLERLIIRACPLLKEIPYEIGEISTLEIIDVDEGSPSAVTSAKQILEEQQSLGNDVLQVRIYQHRGMWPVRRDQWPYKVIK